MIVGKNSIATRTPPGALDIGAGFARLVLQKRDGSEIVVSLRHRTNLVGSADGCRVRLRSADIAPLHAVITRDPTGLQLRRIDPDGRLELNRESIDVGYLRDGDTIRVGPVSMQLSTNVKPVESTELLKEFARHVKTRLSMDPSGLAHAIGEGLQEGEASSSESSPESDARRESEAVHRWQQLTEQLEQQEDLLNQVEQQLGHQERSTDPRVHGQVQELSQIQERIRNEITLLRMWLRPKDAAVVDTSVTAKTESQSQRPVRKAPDPPQRPRVVMRDHNTKAPGTVVVDDFTCDECCGVVFKRRRMKWYELPAWVFSFRGIECTKCEDKTLHLASKIQSLD